MMGPEPEEDAGGYHGQGEPLAHAEVEGQEAEEVVWLPGEFHQEAHQAVTQEEQSGNRAGGTAAGRIQPQDGKQQQPLEGEFVQLGGMAHGHVVLGKDHAPGHVGGAAPELAVDEVADAAGAQAEGDEGGDEVGDGQPSLVVEAGIEGHGQNHAEEAAVEGHAPLPDGENLEGVGEVVAELVEQHVAQPSAQHHSQHAVEQNIVQVLGGPARFRLPAHAQAAQHQH